MTHLSWEQIWDLFDDESDGLEDHRDHVIACTTCTANLKTAQSAASAIRQALHPRYQDLQDRQFADKVLRYVQQRQPAGFPSTVPHRDWWNGLRSLARSRCRLTTGWIAAGTAAVVIVVGGSIWARQARPEHRTAVGSTVVLNDNADSASTGRATQAASAALDKVKRQSAQVTELYGSAETAGTATTAAPSPATLNLWFAAHLTSVDAADQSHPVVGAQVSLFRGSHLLAIAVTDATGSLPPQWIGVTAEGVTQPSGQPKQKLIHTSLTAVMTKVGYRPVVEFGLSGVTGKTVRWDVILHSADRSTYPLIIVDGKAQSRVSATQYLAVERLVKLANAHHQ